VSPTSRGGGSLFLNLLLLSSLNLLNDIYCSYSSLALYLSRRIAYMSFLAFEKLAYRSTSSSFRSSNSAEVAYRASQDLLKPITS
jgi:hypothetical protein